MLTELAVEDGTESLREAIQRISVKCGSNPNGAAAKMLNEIGSQFDHVRVLKHPSRKDLGAFADFELYPGRKFD